MSNHSLLASWRQSLSLLRWSNLKLFLLVSFKAIKDQWKLLLVGVVFYVVIFGFGLSYIFVEDIDSLKEKALLTPLIFRSLKSFIQGLLIALCCFILRPSVDNKCALGYYKHFFNWEILLSIILILLGANWFSNIILLPCLLLAFVWAAVRGWHKGQLGFIFVIMEYFSVVSTFLLFPWTKLTYFFLFDTQKSESFKFFHTLNRGLNFMLYNFPVLLIGCGFYFGIDFATIYLFKWVGLQVGFINLSMIAKLFLGAVSAIVFLAFLSTLYTKKVYEQYELYFSK